MSDHDGTSRRPPRHSPVPLRRIARAAIVVLPIALGSGPPRPDLAWPVTARGSQDTRPLSGVERFQRWLAAVEEHEPGAYDEAVDTVGGWSVAALQALEPYVAAFRERLAGDRVRAHGLTPPERTLVAGLADAFVGRAEPSRPPIDSRRANVVLKRAAILHTDIALMVPGAARGAWGNRARRLLRSQDGRQAGTESGPIHWDVAAWLLDGVQPNPSGDDTVRRWYPAVLAHLQGLSQLGDVSPFVARARALLRDDAQVMMLLGAYNESLVAPRVRNVLSIASTPPAGYPGRQLDGARQDLQRALEIDPDLTEARVRLGHVLGLRGDHDGAIRELERAVASADEPLLEYYAALFLGRERHARGRAAAARAALERAAALYPRAQSPWLALSQLARESGDQVGALRALEQALALPDTERGRNDPWWTYDLSQGRHAEALFAEFRRPFQGRMR